MTRAGPSGRAVAADTPMRVGFYRQEKKAVWTRLDLVLT